MSNLPTARTVRDVTGQIRIGKAVVSYRRTTAGRDRFPWRVSEDVDESVDSSGSRPVDEFATYREAVRCAKMINAGTWTEE